MKIGLAILGTVIGLSSLAQAGDKGYIIQPAPASAPAACYGAGFEFGIFGAGFFPDGGSHDDALGGGLSLGYFFNENFGLDFSGAVYATDPEIHNYTLDAVYRFPINCIAPYVLAGGGVHANSQTEGLFRFGGGVDFRISDAYSVFADGTYNILGGDVEDYTTVRVGLRFGF